MRVTLSHGMGWLADGHLVARCVAVASRRSLLHTRSALLVSESEVGAVPGFGCSTGQAAREVSLADARWPD